MENETDEEELEKEKKMQRKAFKIAVASSVVGNAFYDVIKFVIITIIKAFKN